MAVYCSGSRRYTEDFGFGAERSHNQKRFGLGLRLYNTKSATVDSKTLAYSSECTASTSHHNAYLTVNLSSGLHL